MKKCNQDLIKELKAVQYDLSYLEATARKNMNISYYDGEEEPVRNFNYEEYVKEYDRLMEEERKIRSLLAVSNATTKLIGMEELTISEGLIKLAQLNKRLENMRYFCGEQKVKKDVEHAKFEGDKDRVLITENLYDPNEVETARRNLQREISRLQVAIDRTNLINLIEY